MEAGRDGAADQRVGAGAFGALPVVRRDDDLGALALGQVGPEQVAFLRYRPVLSNRRLKEEMGYVPQRTTAEVLEGFARARGMVLA